MTPPFSPIFISPSQKERTPVSPRQISKAVFDAEKVVFISRLQISMSPPSVEVKMAVTKATAKNVNQI
jgi:hypothetical protein